VFKLCVNLAAVSCFIAQTDIETYTYAQIYKYKICYIVYVL